MCGLQRVLSIVDYFGVVINRFDAYLDMVSIISRLIEDRGGEVLALIPSDDVSDSRNS